MKDNKFTIRIESILGGQSEFAALAGKDQFLASYNIDPDQPIADNGNQSWRTSGYLRPVPSQTIDSATTLSGAPMWLVTNPKDDNVYVYAATGSVYTLNPSVYTLTALGDLTDAGSSSGNGAAYYDNYIYFARDTTIARYGPLNGTPSFTDDYWVGTLSKTALVDTTYPVSQTSSREYSNHLMHRHEGRLYFADVVDNQGTLHYIATTKTTVEGDTNNSSTYQALDFPYGWWPTAIETFNSDLVVALYEGNTDTITFQKRAKLSFWDTSSANYYKVIDVEFPDPFISALKNVNGVLYVFSGQPFQTGVRVSRFVGGYSFEQVTFIEDSALPFNGAVDHLLNRVFFGGTVAYVTGNTSRPGVWAIGSKTGKFSGLFNIMGSTNSTNSTEITALKVLDQDGFNFQIPVIGWAGGSTYGIDRQTTSYGRIDSIWRSQVYRLGEPFKITKIRIPLCQALTSSMSLTVKVYVDEESTSYTLQTVNGTNYPSYRQVVLRSDSSGNPIIGQHNFFVELTWTGTSLLTVGLPIEIEGEIIHD